MEADFEIGNTSYITDDKANITQYDAYLPYGELLVDEHNSSEEMPYKFNGKEMDEETGLYYYGARYMNPVASIWYGVDPLAEKDPGIGGYVYCHENPIILVDPNGMFEKKSQALRFSKRHENAMVLQDSKTNQWFVAMDETGEHAYSKGSTLTRVFSKKTFFSKYIHSAAQNSSYWELSNQVKIDLFDYAVRSYNNESAKAFNKLSSRQKTMKSVRAIGKVGTKYIRFFKVAGRISSVANIAVTADDVITDYQNGKTASAIGRTSVFLITAGAAFIPVVGPAISLGLGAADACCGDKLYNYLDKKFD